ncbi:hypothetical protein BC937DRAFT_87293 [Endogone sp. FLAS-F59071]|nr:hypothetical protein BC937DRAFT_87293 [Endogone sp. FLAS-F59071]|eukprot:RUS19553.1 hypothetical protein BC937DRAFT_87293 [Endogone sp. FLAS-F59071]
MKDQYEQYARDSKACTVSVAPTVGQDKHQSHQTLQNRIAQLEEELEDSRSAQSQLSAIRASLEREKELDILTAKKEVMSQKERALQDMRRDMQREREEAERKWREEGDKRDEDAKRQKEAWQEQLKEANARIRELVKGKAKMMKGARDNNDGGRGQHRISGEALEKLQAQINVLTSWQDEITTRLNVVVGELGEGSTDGEGLDAKDLIDWLKRKFENKDIIIRRLERQLKFKEDLVEGMKRSANIQMEERLTNIKEGMRKEYQQTIEELKRNYRSGNVALSPFTRQSSVPQPHATMVTLQELLSTYPLQFAEYKSTIEVTHRTTLDNLHSQNDAAVANLVSRFATEKEHTIFKHRLEICELRKKYQRAFEKSVRKCIEDPERLESEALRLIQRDKDEAIARTEKRWQSELKQLESAWQQENMKLKKKLLAAEERTDGNTDDDNIAEYDSQIKTLNNAFAHAEEQLQQCISPTEGERDTHVGQRHHQMERNEIRRLQKQYIQTLKMMRDKVLQNKKRNVERMELEWTRRRILLEEQWAQR